MHYTALAAEARHCPCLVQELFPLPFEQYFSLCARRLDRLGVLGIPCHRARRIEFLDGHSLFKPQVKPYICNTEAALTQHLAYKIASLQYRHHRQLVLPVLHVHIPAADAALLRAVRVLRHARWAVFRRLFLLRVFCIFVFIDIISILYAYSSCKLIHINFSKKISGQKCPDTLISVLFIIPVFPLPPATAALMRRTACASRRAARALPCRPSARQAGRSA